MRQIIILETAIATPYAGVLYDEIERSEKNGDIIVRLRKKGSMSVVSGVETRPCIEHRMECFSHGIDGDWWKCEKCIYTEFRPKGEKAE